MARRAKEVPIGLPEAAELLGVHYMTVYRYVRTGRLPATSVGGVWQVDPADVRALANRPSPAPRVRGGSRAKAAGAFTQRLVEGDEAGAMGVMESALSSWAAPAQLWTDILVPAMRQIGDRWETGELTVADEHRAANVAGRVMGRLGPLFNHPGRKRGTVVVGAPPGDRHALPVAVVADLLKDAGFRVNDLGADTPAEAFVEAARRADRLVTVAIGATLGHNQAAVGRTVAALHRALPKTPVIVGGAGVPTMAAARRTRADHWSGPDGRKVVELVEAASR